MKTSLELKRPIVFLKIQTTGTNPKKDRIVQVCFSKITVEGEEKEGSRLINPGIEIPQEVTAINGITNEMVADKPKFEQIAKGLEDFLKDSDFAGFGIREFDLKFLIEEFNRSGIAFSIVGKNIIDLMVFYRKMFPRNFREAVSHYLKENIESEVITSSANVKYSRELMEEMLNQHAGQKVDDVEITREVSVLSALFNHHKGSLDNEGFIVLNEAGRPIFTIGKYKGKLVADSLLNDAYYYNWIIDQSDFPADTKMIVKKIVQKAKSAAEAEATSEQNAQ